jgi:hypothetical protein
VPLALQILDEKRERSLDQLGGVATGKAREVVRAAQERAQLGVAGELDQVPAGRERGHDGRPGRRGQLRRARSGGSDRRHPRLGELPDEGRGVRPGVRSRHELLDLAPRLALRMGEKILVVLRGEVRREQAHRGEMKRTLQEHLEDDGVLAHGPGRFYPAVRGVLGQAQHLRAVREQGRASLAEEQAAGVDLGEVGHEVGCRLSLALGEFLRAGEQLVVVEIHDAGKKLMCHGSPQT